MKKNQKKQWTKFRHKVARHVAYVVFAWFCRLRYHIHVEPFRPEKKGPHLVLLNHQTGYDQFFVGISFREPVYFLATEDIFSMGFASSLIKYFFAPIPIKKQTTDLKAVMNCIRVAREGGTIAIAPEGNRTYSGRTEYMGSAIAPLAKKLGLPIAFYRLEGGYGIQPRWSDVVRKGKMRGYVSRVLAPEEYAQLSDEELFALIQKELYVNEAVADAQFHHKKLAEYLERAIYICPHCGLSEFESKDDIIRCKKCDRQIRYLPTKELEGVGFDFPHRFVAQWYDAQEAFVNALDVLEYTEKPMYTECAALYEVIPSRRKSLISKQVQISLYGDRITCQIGTEIVVFPFEKTSTVTVLGKNKLNVYHGDKVYQVKGDQRFNALKYVHIYHRYKNMKNGEGSTFLGI